MSRYDRLRRSLDKRSWQSACRVAAAGGCIEASGKAEYKDVPGFCKAATLEAIREHEYILTPGRYVGIEEKEDDGEPFEEKMQRLADELSEQFVNSEHLEEKIKANLKTIGFDV